MAASPSVLFPAGLVCFLYLFAFFLSLPLAICDEVDIEIDRQTLLCFRLQLSGPAAVFASWSSNASTEFCDWHGVTCSSWPPRRVVAIDLASQGITGSIPPCVGNLTSLLELQLSNNSFHGAIPSEMGLLSRLTNLNLSMNSLEDLNLSFNNFNGAIPRGGVFDNAGTLSLEGNDHLCASVPTRDRSFNSECEALRNVRHRNVVKIITTCSSVDSTGADFKAIVFQYMPNGNLEKWLHPKGHAIEKYILTLSQKINIGLDVAFALDYPHNQCASPLIHCDLKPSNILLDHNMTAYVSDFGIARSRFTASNAYQDGSTSLAGLKGSIGYIPPEYGMSEEISTKGDVYSFGLILLQMVTGCSPTDEKFKDGTTLHETVDRAFPKNISKIIDPEILQHDSNAAYVMESCVIPLVRIALSCSMTSPKARPEMGQVCNEILRIKHEASNMLVG